jgi:PAS domain S-box-containing protein
MASMKRLTVRYGVAVLAAAAAIALVLIPVIGKGLTSILFLAVFVSALYGGLGPGLLATTLITVIGLVGLRSDPDLPPWRLVSVALFAAGGVLITLLAEALHYDRRRAEASQQWLSAVLTSIGDAVIATDARGVVTFLNPVALTLTGWELENAVGKPLTDIFRIVDEDTHSAVENPVDRVLRENIVVGLANHTVLIAKDGTVRPIDDSGAPIMLEDGKITGVVLVFRDVTHRRGAEAVQARLAAIVESSDDAIVGTRLDGVITSWNAGAQRIFGYVDEEIVGRSIDVLVSAGRRDEVADLLAKLQRGEQINQFESVQITKDGRSIDVSLTLSPIRNSSGRIIGASKIARDITERRRLEQELQRRLAELAEADRRKDEFLAMLAHELRNPLAAFSSAAQLTTRTVDPDELEWCASVINRQINHLTRLIDDLLDVSRITRGNIKLKKEHLDVAEVLRNSIDLVRPLIEERQHTLTVAIEPASVLAEADPVRLEQIVTNLLTNAAKYTESGGQIRLSAERLQDEVVIKVRDSGIGIPQEQLPHIFELFAQGDRSLARSEGGLGIGLTLARSLVELHGGDLTATSAGPGAGSEFLLRLPLSFTLPAGHTGSKPQVSVVSKRRLRVLIVDDNLDMARGMAALLKRLSHEVWTAHDGAAGLEAARSYRPEVILLDIGLPGMDGFLVAEQIRREAFGKEMRIIAVTGYGQEEARQQALSSGFDHFVTKPVDYATLMSLMVAPGSGSPGIASLTPG